MYSGFDARTGYELTVRFVVGMLLAYQVKHFLADYLLQGYPLAPGMVRKFAPRLRDAYGALFDHALVHGFLTMFIVSWTLGMTYDGFAFAGWMCCFDTLVHFTMDRIKASPNLLGRYKPMSAQEFQQAKDLLNMGREKSQPIFEKFYHRRMWQNTLFWWSLGFDQFVHHLTHYTIIYWTLTYGGLV